jgi:CubicO group peptidase (beta-lactamase class C family)
MSNSFSELDFSEMHNKIQEYVDNDFLSGASSIVLKDNKIVDSKCWGFMDKEAGKETKADTIFRIYSNTKKIVTVAALCLLEDGCFDLDEPIAKYLPELGNLQVLKQGSKDLSQTEPLVSQPSIRQLMSHSAGFSYGIFAESLVDSLYVEKHVLDTEGSLKTLVEKLADIPLAYQPGTRWQYSVATDILARLVEIWSGMSIDEFLKLRVLNPLGMIDTDFFVPLEKQDRFAANYVPVDMMDPMKMGLNIAPDTLVGGYLSPKTFMSGGGGLVSTITDYTRFIQMLVGEGSVDDVRILKAETVLMMHENQLAKGIKVVLPLGSMPETVFGLGVAIKTIPAEGEPELAIGEFHWGGLAGTHTWISPDSGIAALIFTQRLPGFWHPFSHDYKRLVYKSFC